MLFECVLLKAGDGRFKVESAEEGFSKNGNPMLILKIRLYDYENTECVITEYLTKALLYKARAILRAGGMALPHGQTKAEWGILDFEGRQGKCEIGIEAPQGNFSAKNIVKAYLEPQAGSLTPQNTGTLPSNVKAAPMPATPEGMNATPPISDEVPEDWGT